ncbi:FUSC family protein [Gibbsiella quercinecans]|uniref:FUSC family protein n=1 Tax=Gibbsiella quercinecans TaxID=929813 RepID=UPI0015FFE8EA|nr:FUSC family protein [Gibbsiella quercinecans]
MPIRLPITLQQDMLLGLCCLPAIIVIYLVGFALDRVPAASVVASGALTLAFGANKTWGGSAFSLLITTTFGLAFSSWLGCLTGNVLPLYIAGAMLYAGVYVTMANVDSSAWWMLLQWAIAYLVSGYFAGSAEHAAARAAMTGGGGLLQMLFLALVFRRYGFHRQDFSPRSWLRFLRITTSKYKRKIHLQWSIFYALLTMCLALSTVELFHLKNGYWAGMTLLFCLRNNYKDTVARVQARVLGTLMGSILAAALIAYWHSPLLLVSGFILFGYIAFTFSYSLISKSYFIFTFFVTLMVVFMISSLGFSQVDVATHRLESTALGGMFAIFAVMMTRLFTRRQIVNK